MRHIGTLSPCGICVGGGNDLKFRARCNSICRMKFIRSCAFVSRGTFRFFVLRSRNGRSMGSPLIERAV